MCCFLFRRKGLKIALSGREGKSLTSILRFLIKYIGDYRFTRILIDVANILLGKYYQTDYSDVLTLIMTNLILFLHCFEL